VKIQLSFVMLAAATLAGPPAWSQPVDQNKRLLTIRQIMDDVQAFAQGLSENDRRMFSAGAQNLFQASQRWPGIEQRIRAGQINLSELRSKLDARPGASLSVSFSNVAVSNPAHDFFLSQDAGFTQSETSAAW
jgi:hypothetical protein